MSNAVGWGAIAAALLSAAAACTDRAPARHPQRIKLLSRIVVAGSSQALVEHYNRSIQAIDSSLEIIPGSESVVNALQAGRAELGFAQADVIYTAYRFGSDEDRTPNPGLRAIAVAQRASVLPVVRAESEFHSLADLRGRRIGVDPTGSRGEVYARMLLAAYGLEEADVSLAHLLPDRMAAGVRDGTLDAAMLTGPSLASIAPIVGGMTIRLLDVDRARINALRGRFPFMLPSLIADPAGGADTHTVGVDNVLVCRGDLAEDIVYQLTAGLFALSDRFQSADPRFPPWIDLERAPATPIPLHPGAARYYRERQIAR